MKKSLFFLFIFFFIQKTYALDESCFQYAWDISWIENKTIKIITDNINNYYFQDGNFLATKVLSNFEKKFFSFRVNGVTKTNYTHTFEQYETLKQINIFFPETLQKNTFHYEISTNNYNYYFEISKDGKDWYKIEDNIRNYDLDYLRITFDNKNLKNTTIYELNFYQNGNNEVLINSISANDIHVYNEYVCDNDELSKIITKSKKTLYFPIDINTQTQTLILKPNPTFNPNHIINIINKDTDSDEIIDTNDNCKNHYNPDQLDSDADGIGDMCSDSDKDGILWYIDNCPLIHNPDQIDENKNGIGDICEIDTDTDGVYDIIDNCPFIYNPEQFDSDSDGIGDACDNCREKFNPNQKDIDKDNIGDVCDDKDNRFIESNKTFFIGFLVFLIILFLWKIYSMVRQIEGMKRK